MAMLVALYWLTMAGWPGSEMLIFARDRTPAAGTRVDRGSRALILAALAVAIFGAISLAELLPATRFPAPRIVTAPAGLVVMWAGIVLRLWSVRTLGRYFRTHVTMFDDHRLIDRGLYARIRNPAYLGSLVTCLGFGVALGNGASLALMLLLPGIALSHRIRIEERALAGHFGGAWSAYRARSWALLPPFW